MQLNRKIRFWSTEGNGNAEEDGGGGGEGTERVKSGVPAENGKVTWPES
jgi:hypothetical protein